MLTGKVIYGHQIARQIGYPIAMKIQLKYEKPILNNVLNCYTILQVEERFNNCKCIIETLKHMLNTN